MNLRKVHKVLDIPIPVSTNAEPSCISDMVTAEGTVREVWEEKDIFRKCLRDCATSFKQLIKVQNVQVFLRPLKGCSIPTTCVK